MKTTEDAEKFFAAYLNTKCNSLSKWTVTLAKQTNTPYIEANEVIEDGYPNCYNDIFTAASLIYKPIGIWYSWKQMCVVVENEDGSKIGIRSVDISRQGRNPKIMQSFIEALNDK